MSRNPHLQLVLESPEREAADSFDAFWKRYPARNGRKIGKGECWEKWKTYTPRQREQILRALDGYVKFLADAQTQLARDPIRFLRRDWWQSFLDPVVPKNIATRPPFPPATDPIGRSLWRRQYGEPSPGQE